METSVPQEPKGSLFKPFISFLLIAFFINLAAVNYVLYKNNAEKSTAQPTSSPSASATPSATVCDEICVRKIVAEATASIVLTTPKPTTIIKPTKTAVPSASVAPAAVREIFVAIGAGKSSGSEWSDITGAEASITASQFGSIKAAYFEVTLSVPSTEGIGYARLYNASDAKTVAGSDVSTTNSGPTFLISQPIALEGTKLYKVQTKSTENKDVVVTQSRIRVVLN